ncbi:MAG: glutamate racemase [Ignavibacteriae bacterium]|nr:glutamate racemase [Ignavibacteriota bacterium]
MKSLQIKNLHKRPIGVFDSGIGGLTVARALFEILPNENIIYLGDTARLPYGTKSKETVILYSIECLKFLLSKKVKMIVVACNTASSFAVPFLQKITKIPVIGVLIPGSEAAVNMTKNNKIGLIGTLGTVKSLSYKKAIIRLNKKAEVFSQACSLFVQLAEDGWTDNKIAELTAKEYLTDISKKGIDTMILGCTHYPILKNTISKVIGKNIKLIDSGEETAKKVNIILQEKKLLNTQKKKGEHRFFVTDFPNNFHQIAERFLGKKIHNVKQVKL